ncbi:MAG TPA: stage II sporulation protein M [Herpetosiphonaceae bacterium]
MTLFPIRAVAQREMRDNLTDWRMMFPIVILTFVVPILILAAALYTVDFIGDLGSVARLIPFGLLLSGFLPASFSLITALESFVGEKERNTLEALLAMPMSDGELYLGKLLAALLPPVGSALLAMITYAVCFNLTARTDIQSLVNGRIMWLMVALIVIKGLVMVAGAVIISSHTTTIRAANLLASFVLVPISIVVQLEALVIIAQQQQLLWNIFWALLAIALLLVRTGMNSFNREEILSREHAGFNFKGIVWSFKQFFSEFHPAGVAPDRYSGTFSLRRFYRRELSALLHEYRAPLVLSFIAVMTGLIFGIFAFGVYRADWLDSVLKQHIETPPTVSGWLVLRSIAGNLRDATFSNLVSLFCFGILAFLIPAAAFAKIGYIAVWNAAHGVDPLSFALAYVLPHGVIELPALILSSAMGIRLGASVLYAPRGFTIGQNILWSLANFAKVFLFVLLPLFVISGLIEGLITPNVARMLFDR